jgi:hypothetical protein
MQTPTNPTTSKKEKGDGREFPWEGRRPDRVQKDGTKVWVMKGDKERLAAQFGVREFLSAKPEDQAGAQFRGELRRDGSRVVSLYEQTETRNGKELLLRVEAKHARDGKIIWKHSYDYDDNAEGGLEPRSRYLSTKSSFSERHRKSTMVSNTYYGHGGGLAEQHVFVAKPGTTERRTYDSSHRLIEQSVDSDRIKHSGSVVPHVQAPQHHGPRHGERRHELSP